jgi:hypothetical protein
MYPIKPCLNLLSGLTDLVIFSLEIFYYLLSRTSWERARHEGEDQRRRCRGAVVAVGTAEYYKL